MRIPLGTDAFEPGEAFQLVLLCDGQQVAPFDSTFLTYFLDGLSVDLPPIFLVDDPMVASLTADGLLTAASAGQTRVHVNLKRACVSKAGFGESSQFVSVDVSVTCPSGTTTCGAECVDLLQDTQNCGGCGNACTSAEACLAGQCVSQEADLSVTPVAIPPDPVPPGDSVQFQFYVNNQGPGTAADVSASVHLSAGLNQPKLIMYAPGSGSVPCGVVALSGGGNLATCSVARLEPGDTATIEGSAITTAPGQEVAAAFVSAQPPENAQQQLDNYAEASWTVDCASSNTCSFLFNSEPGTCSQGASNVNGPTYGLVVIDTSTVGLVTANVSVVANPGTEYSIWLNQDPGDCPTTPTRSVVTDQTGTAKLSVTKIRAPGATSFWVSAQEEPYLQGKQILRSVAR